MLSSFPSFTKLTFKRLSAVVIMMSCVWLCLLLGLIALGVAIPAGVHASSHMTSREMAADDTTPPAVVAGNATTASTPTSVGDADTNVTESTTVTPTTEEDTNTCDDEVEPSLSISIFFIFILLAVCIILVHLMIKIRFHYLPESIAFVLIGFVVGLVLFIVNKATRNDCDYRYVEYFRPESFFLLLLPPIIFESGYSLHKGNFFQNLGSIVLFAVFGTVISALIVGGGLFGLCTVGVVTPKLNFVQSFTFGSLISAVDPVATLAIFHALDVSPTLNMLVFGESVLNDAVSIVMTKTILEQASSSDSDNTGVVLARFLGKFLLMFFVSALIGIFVALSSALFLKFVNLRKHYSLEFAMWLIFAFGPYFLAEGLQLSGIMSVLFCGIVMSHYTHLNLSPVTQVTVQQTMRTISFMAETVVFLYIGMQLFTIPTHFRVEMIIWSLILILVGRAANIFPLSFLINYFRSVKISSRMQFVMWFSGLRGAIAYALALNLKEKKDVFDPEYVQILNTTTLIIVLFTIVALGGSTLPLLKFLSKSSDVNDVTLSKTEEQGTAVATTPAGEMEEPHLLTGSRRHQWFVYLDFTYIKPLLVRRFTKQEVRAERVEMQRRTNEWYQGLREASEEEDELNEEEAEDTQDSTFPSSASSSHSGRTSPPTATNIITTTVVPSPIAPNLVSRTPRSSEESV